MIFGDEIISYLADNVSQSDSRMSSHWEKYHKNFNYKNGNFSGLEGFGNNSPSYTPFRYLINNLFLTRYRNFGRKFKFFNDFDRLNSIILKKQNRAYSLDPLRQTISLSFLNDKIPSYFDKSKTVWVIGDGFANMTTLLYLTGKFKRIVSINLTKTPW